MHWTSSSTLGSCRKEGGGERSRFGSFGGNDVGIRDFFFTLSGMGRGDLDFRRRPILRSIASAIDSNEASNVREG